MSPVRRFRTSDWAPLCALAQKKREEWKGGFLMGIIGLLVVIILVILLLRLL
jgi:hypothetical protein